MRQLLGLVLLAGVASAADEPLRIAAPQNGGYTKVLYTPDGLRMIGVGYTGEAVVWDVKTGKELAKISTGKGGGQSSVASAVVVNDGATLAVGVQTFQQRGHGIFLYDLRTGKETAHWPAGDAPTSMAESPDGKLLASGGGGKVRLFELATGEEKTPLATPDKETVGTGLGWTPDGKKLLVPVNNRKGGGELLVWEVESGAIQHRLPTAGGYAGRSFAVLPGGTELLAYDRPDPKTGTSKLAVWSLETGKQVRTLKLEGRFVSELALTPDGKRAVMGDTAGGGLVLTDLETGKPVQKWGKWYNTSAAVSPDGNSFVSCGSSADPENPTAGVMRVRIDGLKK